MILLVPLVFFLLGLGAAAVCVWKIYESLQARHWPCVQAVVTQSEIREFWHSDDGFQERAYAVDVRYSYRVGEKEFTGTRIGINDPPFPRREWAEAFRNEFPVGRTLEARHHPERPERSLLRLGTPGYLYVGVIAGLIFLTSAVFLASVLNS